MPRVNIHEIDNTKPGTRAYSNFSVVVPGFHAPYCSRETAAAVLEEKMGIVLDKEVTDKVTGVKSYPPLTDAEVFGDENVLEIKTQADFEQYIGFVKPIAYNEGFKASAVSREILAEDVYGDPSQILYYDGKEEGVFPIDQDFVVEQNKEENTITFTYRSTKPKIPTEPTKVEKPVKPVEPKETDEKYKKEDGSTDTAAYNADKAAYDTAAAQYATDLAAYKAYFEAKKAYDEFMATYGPEADDAWSEKYTEEEKVTYKYVVNGFDVSLFKKPMKAVIGTAPFKLSDDETYSIDSEGRKCSPTGELYELDAEDNIVMEDNAPVVVMTEAVDYDLGNPISKKEAYVLLDDEQKVIAAGCYFPTVKEFKTQYFQWRPDIRLPAHYGNQIAYELLGLGYTIYYVNMGEWNPTKEDYDTAYEDDAERLDRGFVKYKRATALTKEQIKEGLSLDEEPIDEDAAIPEYYLLDKYGNKIPEMSDKKVNVGMANIDKAYKALGSETFWAPLRDKTTYDYRFVLTGFIEEGNFTAGGFRDYMKNANFEIAKLASWEAPGEDAFAHVRARGDCLALIDLDEDNIAYHFASTTSGQGNTTKRLVSAIQKDLRRQNFGLYGKYSAVFTPSVTYANNLKQDVYQNCKFPASFHYLACFAKSVFADNFKEWFAVAGFTRGLSTYNIDSVGFKLGDVAMNALEPRFQVSGSPVNVAVNVIVNNRGSYYIWGNRTAHTLGTELTASHFLNIRQLCITLKKFIFVLCRKFTFDPNSDVLWANFVNGLTPCLENMKANQGIRDYAIIKVPTDLKGVLKATVRIVPIEAVEDFDITVSLEDSLDGAVVGE